jgi:hypothetical protein
MSMSASLEILNNTGSGIMFTTVDQVNDDATWAAPAVGSVLPTGQSATIAMGNSSVFFAPRGVGANVYFICQSNFKMGQIYFDDPAVGEHSFNFDQSGVFNYAVTNLDGNSYVVAITLK